MTMKPLALGIAILGVTALAGCEVYYGDRTDGWSSGETYCDATGCWYCDDYGCYPIDGDGRWEECRSNDECAAGCYCDDGACIETGFCNSDADCPEALICDDRATCVPDDSIGRCGSDADCPRGTRCDRRAGVCIGSPTCTSNDDCDPGYACDDRGTCAPVPCTADDQCVSGAICDTTTGLCVDTAVCGASTDCADGMKCDTARRTCVPCGDGGCTPQPGSCYEQPVCDSLPPTCPSGTLPGVIDGCYSGLCIPEALCPDPKPWACADATGEAECLDHGCEPVFVGIDCTDPAGGTCSGDQPDCTCDRFEYGFCRDQTAP